LGRISFSSLSTLDPIMNASPFGVHYKKDRCVRLEDMHVVDEQSSKT
jgi:hypothetical protein